MPHWRRVFDPKYGIKSRDRQRVSEVLIRPAAQRYKLTDSDPTNSQLLTHRCRTSKLLAQQTLKWPCCNPAHMTERQKETRFLKTLIVCDNSEQARQLEQKIKLAEKDERCIRAAVYLVGIMALLSLSGLGYSAVFVPQIAHFSSHLATRICCDIGLASLMCMLIFAGYWVWYRAVSNRVFEDCRRFLRPLLESRLKDGSPPSPILVSANPTLRVYRSETEQSQDDTDFFQLSKAS